MSVGQHHPSTELVAVTARRRCRQGTDHTTYHHFGGWRPWPQKTVVEAAFTLLTYVAVNWLKRVENEDYYDHDTNFTPLSLED